MKLPISAIVVGFNEDKVLRSCLESILFCDEILYFDLGSSDSSIAIAQEFGAKVIHHEKVLSCEWIHAEYAKRTKNEWVLITDPDEVVDAALKNQIENIFEQNQLTTNIGCVTVPWLFYFKKRRLIGTVWGGVNQRILLVNNKRFEFLPFIHVGRRLLDGYKSYNIAFNNTNCVRHYWMQSYNKLFEKHLRYLKNEGEARYNIGSSTTLKTILAHPYRAFKNSFLLKQGYKDAFTGFFLSIFWAWYDTSALIMLYKYQKKSNK
jgi:glycosyltransferase involved in cell wall biosynthesis